MNNRGFSPVVLIQVIIIAAISYWIALPATVLGRDSMRQACMSNLKHLGLSAFMYTQDYGERFMPSAGWASDKILNYYVNNGRLFNCPAVAGTAAWQTDYEYNANLAGRYMAEIKYPPTQVILLGDNKGRPMSRQSSRAGTNWGTSTHEGGINFLMVDGHVRWAHNGAYATHTGYVRSAIAPGQRVESAISSAGSSRQYGVASRQAIIQGQEVGEVLVNGDVVLRIRTSAGGNSPARRAEIVASRFEILQADGLPPDMIYAAGIQGDFVVMAGREVLVTVDEGHARLNGTHPSKLAQIWAENIAHKLGGSPGKSMLVSNRGGNRGATSYSSPTLDSDSMRQACMSNLKQLGLSAFMYTQDYGERFMPSAGWASDKILNYYVNNGRLFNCPAVAGTAAWQTDYEYNANLAGRYMAEIKYPLTQVILLGDNKGRPMSRQSSRAGTNWGNSTHERGINFLMADGHIRWVHNGANAPHTGAVRSAIAPGQ